MDSKLDSKARPSSVALTPEDLSNISLANRYVEENEEDANSERAQQAKCVSLDNSDYKSSKGISLAEPEPETSYDKSLDDHSSFEKTSTSLSYSEYDYLLAKFKQQRGALLSVIIGLSVALLGCIIGIIIMKVLPRKSPVLTNSELPNELNLIVGIDNKVDDPWRIHKYPTVSSDEKDIAEIFTDHTLYQTFYGVTYNGPDPSYYPNSSHETNNMEITALAKRDEDGDSKHAKVRNSSYKIQHQISIDMALLSRVTTRIRLIYSSANRLTERVLQALVELNLNLTIHLSVSAAKWEKENVNIRELINSAPPNLISAVYLERDASEDTTVLALMELQAFLNRRELADNIEVSLVEPQKSQANPLNLSEDKNLAISYLNNDKGRNLYTNLETSPETSEKARTMFSWVCGIAPNLRKEIEWFWANSFDDGDIVLNGIFSKDRVLKPAGLPRCSA